MARKLSHRHNLITTWTRQRLNGEISQKELENRIRPLFAKQLKLTISEKREENDTDNHCLSQ